MPTVVRAHSGFYRTLYVTAMTSGCQHDARFPPASPLLDAQRPDPGALAARGCRWGLAPRCPHHQRLIADRAPGVPPPEARQSRQRTAGAPRRHRPGPRPGLALLRRWACASGQDADLAAPAQPGRHASGRQGSRHRRSRRTLLAKPTSRRGSNSACAAPMRMAPRRSARIWTATGRTPRRTGRCSAGMRDAWAGRIDLQAVSICPLERFAGDDGVALANEVADSGGILGMTTTGEGGQASSPDSRPCSTGSSPWPRNAVWRWTCTSTRPATRPRARCDAVARTAIAPRLQGPDPGRPCVLAVHADRSRGDGDDRAVRRGRPDG